MNKFKQNSSNNFIVFIHIEKAAGTSFNHFLRNNISSYKTLNNPLFFSKKYQGIFTKKMLQRLIQQYPNIKGIGGHTLRPYLDYESCIKNNNISYITFLRNPIDRYLSHFNYQNAVMGKDRKLEEFIEHEEFSNFQTKKIAGNNNIDEAKSILTNDFDFVGTTEYFKESIQLLIEKFPLILNNNYIFNKNVANISDYRYQHLTNISSDILNKIKNQNKNDLILYDFVTNELLAPNLNNSIRTNIVIINNNKFVQKTIFLLKSILLTIYKQYFEKIIVPHLYKN